MTFPINNHSIQCSESAIPGTERVALCPPADHCNTRTRHTTRTCHRRVYPPSPPRGGRNPQLPRLHHCDGDRSFDTACSGRISNNTPHRPHYMDTRGPTHNPNNIFPGGLPQFQVGRTVLPPSFSIRRVSIRKP